MAQSETLIDRFTIGPADADEMGAICEIAKVAWEPIHDAMIDMVGEEIHDATAQDWRSRKAEQIQGHYERHPEWVLAVREGEEVAGFVTFRLDADRAIGTIGNNAVGSGYQGQGIATAMYRYVLDLFKREGMMFAAVTTGLDPGHAPARRAYEKAGFDLHREDITYYKRLGDVAD
jgi:ribosomal protein S18 acetylase RimI-like enzyme